MVSQLALMADRAEERICSKQARRAVFIRLVVRTKGRTIDPLIPRRRGYLANRRIVGGGIDRIDAQSVSAAQRAVAISGIEKWRVDPSPRGGRALGGTCESVAVRCHQQTQAYRADRHPPAKTPVGHAYTAQPAEAGGLERASLRLFVIPQA